jgi:hypothetical protein
MGFDKGTKVKWQIQGDAWMFGIVMGQDPYKRSRVVIRVGVHTWQVEKEQLHLAGKKAGDAA